MQPKIILRIDDVGRRAGDTPEHGRDSHLEYFAEWRERSGLMEVPAVYGVVPTWISPRGLKWLAHNLPASEIAVHGCNHRRGDRPTVPSMGLSRALLSVQGLRYGCTAYIPPFNDYVLNEIGFWGDAGGSYFFGGFNVLHHELGEQPFKYTVSSPGNPYSVIHLSACEQLYGRARDLVSRINLTKWPDYPLVATLHVPWEEGFVDMQRFIDTIKPYVVPLHTVKDWFNDSTGHGSV